MDTATIVIVERLLAIGGLRETARQLGRPAASIALALSRMQGALAVDLLQVSGGAMLRTLDGERLFPLLCDLASEVSGLFGLPPGHPVPSLRLDALHRLLTVARKGSIRAAARELGIGQPQLTRQLAHAEDKIGSRLLTRLHDGAVPTERGLEVIRAARSIEDLWRDMAARSGEKFRRQATTVRVGSIFPLGAESSVAGLLAGLAARWRLHHPRQPLFITSMIAEELLNGIRRGLFDMVLLDLAELPADLDGVELSRSVLVLVASRETAERAGGTLDSILLTSPLAVPSARSGLRQIIDGVLETGPFLAWRGRQEAVDVDSIPVILRLVADHGFVSFLPAASLPGEGRFAALPLPVPVTLPLYAAWPRGKGDHGLVAQVVALAKGK
nr:LysR family transcriptional regulator [uncultured Gellertiella sp.]